MIVIALVELLSGDFALSTNPSRANQSSTRRLGSHTVRGGIEAGD